MSGRVRPRLTSAFVSAACVATLAAACGGSTTVTEITGPTGTAARCQTAVSASSGTLPAGGGTVTATVSAGRECTWSASSEVEWVRVAPASGQGQGTLEVTADANPAGQPRSAAVVVNEQRLSLSQDPAPCRYELGSAPRMSHTGGRATMPMSATDGCGWDASSSAEWARVLSGSGTGAGTVQLEIAPNPGSTRTATITAAGETRSITQEGRSSTPAPGPPTPDPPPPPSCAVTIDRDERSFGSAGGNGSVRVNAAAGCSWNAAADASWLELSRSSGTGSEDLRYTVAANTRTDSRTGIITIAGRTHTVRQDGAPAPPPGDDDDDDDDDDDGGKIEVSGRAWFVAGSCPSVAFSVDWRRVFTDGSTKFKGGKCGDIRNGVEVEVEGRLVDGRVRASEVHIRDDDDD